MSEVSPSSSNPFQASGSGNVCPAGEACAYYEEVITLRTEVITDPLTSLYNVRYFRQILEQELERTQRTLISTAIMMIDLDHFKQVNDTYGHEFGNQVLQHIARLIRDTTRKLDIQCRYGGEEFVVILPSTELMLAVHVAQRLRESIESTPVFLEDDSFVSITASIGLALHSTDAPLTASELVAAADAQLYRAKKQGRNQVCYPRVAVPDTQVSGDEKEALGSMFAEKTQGVAAADDEQEAILSGFFAADENDDDDFIADDDGEQWIV